MPELPEVNNFKRYFNETSLGKTIENVDVHDDKIIRNMPGPAFADALKGRKIVSSLRRGKYLFARLDNGHDLLLHFGMTGDLNYYSAPEDKGRYERFVLNFTDGDKLGFEDPRKFARILYLEDRDAYIKEIKLGPDALDIDGDYLVQKMTGKKGSIKGFLLNQQILSGVGNLYADEICYRCRLSPALRLNELTEDEKCLLAKQTIEVMTGAAANAPYYKDYPENWYWHVWRTEGKSGPEGIGEVVVTKVAGRTTYFVKGWQRE
ncbi:DNA-(apurinic or apyrimidinic site) lyase [Lewinellaceae bacterium SD302]|nr:DNA-(apurinic or apyrimidinic site) lyase [Lewinellaceae bacterium SD302]